MGQVTEQYVDLQVTQAKYDKELDCFFQQYYEWQRKGVFLINDEFPVLEFLFLTPRTFAMSAVFAVRIDFTNYDTEPPSVKFIDPYTKKLITRRDQIPLKFKQKATAEFLSQKKPKNPVEGIEICISIGSEPPFICHPGFKEYHEHPYHTGDSWLIHRTKGEGRLYRILQVLYDHSIALVESIGFQQTGKKEAQIFFNQRNP